MPIVDRTNPIWALTFCRDHFGLTKEQMVQIGTDEGLWKLQYLWEREHNGLYESPLYLLRQEWYHMVEGEREAFPEFWEALDERSVVLDFGCGTAEYARLPWIDHGRDIILVDISEVVIGYLRAKLPSYGEAKLCCPESFWSNHKVESIDALLCLDVLEHLVDPIGMTETLCRYLKPGGNALFAFSEKWPHPGHLIESIHRSDEWIEWMKAHMEYVGRHEKGPLWFRKPR